MADAVRCENCDRHADRPSGPDPFVMGRPEWMRPLPSGWLRVIVQEANALNAAVESPRAEVCGWMCAADWTRDRAVEFAERAADMGALVEDRGR